MISSEQLTALVPAEGDLTGEHGRPEAVHQRHTLVNGALKPWTGRVQTVRSAICVRTGDGSLEQVELGSYPMGGIPEAEEALAAAVAAYDDGGGEWPTMTVAERIACMQDFTKQMIARREQIVTLIMWEIGKTREIGSASTSTPRPAPAPGSHCHTRRSLRPWSLAFICS